MLIPYLTPYRSCLLSPPPRFFLAVKPKVRYGKKLTATLPNSGFIIIDFERYYTMAQINYSVLALFIPTFLFVSTTPGMCMTLSLTLGMTIGVRRTLWMMIGVGFWLATG